MNNNPNQENISSNNQGLTKYSSSLIKRGLALAQNIQPTSKISLKSSQNLTTQINKSENIINSLLICGVSHYHSGNIYSGIECFNQVLKINHKHIDSLCLRGFLNDDTGNKQEAEEDFKQVAAVKSDEKQEIHTLYAQGCAYFLSKDLAKGLSEIK